MVEQALKASIGAVAMSLVAAAFLPMFYAVLKKTGIFRAFPQIRSWGFGKRFIVVLALLLCLMVPAALMGPFIPKCSYCYLSGDTKDAVDNSIGDICGTQSERERKIAQLQEARSADITKYDLKIVCSK